MFTPAHARRNSIRQLRVFALAGVSEANIEGESIVAVQKNPLLQFRSTRKRLFVEEFANSPDDPDGVLRFTKQFGALLDTPPAGTKFSFPIRDWQQKQKTIRSQWDLVAYLSEKWAMCQSGRGTISVPVEPGEEMISADGTLAYRASSLSRLALIEFASISPERLRKCAAPGCKTPYFVASHLGQHYCSETCSQWAQREYKKRWWEKHGPSWRQKRKKMESKKRRGVQDSYHRL